MSKIIYLKTEVKLGQIIDFKGLKITLTQEIIDDNPTLFEVKENIPEYVECTSWSGKLFKEGQIYPTKNGKAYNNDGVIACVGKFKPSTKEAYVRQELLKEAKRKYPVGTKIKNAYCPEVNTDIRTITSEPYFKGGDIYVKVAETNTHINLIHNGVWAEIVKPILISEDGVEIYDGDWYYFVKNLNIGHCRCIKGMPSGEQKPGDINFSTKEAAEEYIAKHKEKTLEDYENFLLTFKTPLYAELKSREPALYWTKILQLIANDLNGSWEPPVSSEDQTFTVNLNEWGEYDCDGSWGVGSSGKIAFNSIKSAKKAIKILGEENLDKIYKNN